MDQSIRVEAATITGSSQQCPWLSLLVCSAVHLPLLLDPRHVSLLCVWSSQCCLVCSGCMSRDGIVGWIQVPSLPAGCSQVWGYLAEELKAGVFSSLA